MKVAPYDDLAHQNTCYCDRRGEMVIDAREAKYDATSKRLQTEADGYADLYVQSQNPVHRILAFLLERAALWNTPNEDSILSEAVRYDRYVENLLIVDAIKYLFPDAVIPEGGGSLGHNRSS